MTQYACDKPASRSDIHGEFACTSWSELQPAIDLSDFAITQVQALEISASICGVLFIGWLFGEFGSFIKSIARGW